MPSFKLSTQRLNTGGQGGQLQAPMFSGAAAASFRAAKVNPNAGHVRFAPMPVPQIQPDPTLESAISLADTFTKAAFRVREMEETSTADQAVLGANNKFREAFYGTEEAKGYGATQGQEAVESYSAFNDRMSGIMHGALGNMSDSVKAKALTRMNASRNAYLNKGAMHKASQLNVWNSNLQQAKAEAVKRDIITDSASPVEFVNTMSGFLNDIDAEYIDRPAMANVAKQKFVTEIFSDVITYHTDTGNFALAAQYIGIGASISADDGIGADPAMLAKRSRQMEVAMRQKQNLAEQAARDRDSRDERIANQVALVALNQAVVNGDPSELNAIGNPITRSKLKTVWNNLRKSPASDDLAVLKLRSQMPDLIDDSSLVLDMDMFSGVEAPERIAIYSELEKLKEKGVTSYLKQGDGWIDTLFATYDARPAGAKVGDNALSAFTSRKKMLDVITSHLLAAKQNDKSFDIALFDAQKEIRDNPDFLTEYKIAQMPRQALKSIPGLYDGGMMALDFEMDEPVEVWKESVQIEYQTAGYALAEKYGVAGRGKIEGMKRLYADPILRSNYMREVSMLEDQMLYYTNQVSLREQKAAKKSQEVGK